MDCALCSTLPDTSRLPGNVICGACFDGAQKIIKMINKIETENGNAKPSKSLWDASSRVAGLTETEDELPWVSFLHLLVDDYKHSTPPDILLNPGNDGPPIAAHTALLAARSKVFKYMLESDTCKALPMETITLSELNYETLEALLEFLYSGSLPEQKLEKHIYQLSLAAHKYEIIYLPKLCQNYMLKTLHLGNALAYLEISDFCSFQMVRNNAMNLIVKHLRNIVYSAEYGAFAVKNPDLAVEIMRASEIYATKKRVYYVF